MRTHWDGRPLSKAERLEQLTEPDGPEWPLDGDITAELVCQPGPMPRSARHYLDLLPDPGRCRGANDAATGGAGGGGARGSDRARNPRGPRGRGPALGHESAGAQRSRLRRAFAQGHDAHGADVRRAGARRAGAMGAPEEVTNKARLLAEGAPTTRTKRDAGAVKHRAARCRGRARVKKGPNRMVPILDRTQAGLTWEGTLTRPRADGPPV